MSPVALYLLENCDETAHVDLRKLYPYGGQPMRQARIVCLFIGIGILGGS